MFLALACSLRAMHLAQINKTGADRTAAYLLSAALLVGSIFAYSTAAEMNRLLLEMGKAAPATSLPYILQLMAGILAISHVMSWAELNIGLPFGNVTLVRLLVRAVALAILLATALHPSAQASLGLVQRILVMAGCLFFVAEGWNLPRVVLDGLGPLLYIVVHMIVFYLCIRWSWGLFWNMRGNFAYYVFVQLPGSLIFAFLGALVVPSAMKLLSDAVSVEPGKASVISCLSCCRKTLPSPLSCTWAFLSCVG